MIRPSLRAALAACAALAALLALRAPSDALPSFSMQTGLQCDACHTSIRSTNDLGQAYLRNDMRLPNLGMGGKPVVAVRGQFAYTSEPDGSNQLPKATLDELEVFLAARLTPQVSVAGQFYVIDGGQIGAVREAWAQYSTRGSFGGAPVRFTVGSVTLPLPVDPETFRQTNQHYAIFDQTVGANPFTLIDPHNAVTVALGNPVRGSSATFAAVEAHDKQSGLPRTGTDRMIQAQEAIGGLVLSVYDYTGQRQLGDVPDTFKRRGVGMNYYRGRLAVETALQTGYNSSPNGDGIGIASSGGFAQLRWQLPHGTFGIVRYDGVNDSSGGFARSFTIGGTHLLSRGLAIEAEDVIERGERTKHTLNASLRFGVSNTRLGSGAY
ncbi:MAG: hypothetical protein QOF71_3501 [Candidatus Eremiobacteraeota bacterium]|jgi:hypothetical protein|nr:hypothetical protein [Candidatus Eremiobacteraeota bacterium]